MIRIVRLRFWWRLGAGSRVSLAHDEGLGIGFFFEKDNKLLDCYDISRARVVVFSRMMMAVSGGRPALF
jgi:hypothetical protein